MKTPPPQRLRCPHCEQRTLMDAAPVGPLFHCEACGWYADLAAALEPADEATAIVAMNDVPALFEQVYAAPAADAPRRQLADALQQQGDPRGRFIALQLAAAAGSVDAAGRTTVQLLQRDHGDAWLPPGVKRETAVFRRGFPFDLEWVAETDAEHPAWRLVDTLRCRLDDPQHSVFGRARPLLRAVLGASGALLNQLLTIRPPALEELETRVGLQDLGHLARELERFPRLKRLSVQPDHFELTSRHLGEVLTRFRVLSQLTLPLPRVPLQELLRQRDQLAPGLHLHLTLPEGDLVLELGPRFVGVRMVGEPREGFTARLDALMATLLEAGLHEVTQFSGSGQSQLVDLRSWIADAAAARAAHQTLPE